MKGDTFSPNYDTHDFSTTMKDNKPFFPLFCLLSFYIYSFYKLWWNVFYMTIVWLWLFKFKEKNILLFGKKKKLKWRKGRLDKLVTLIGHFKWHQKSFSLKRSWRAGVRSRKRWGAARTRETVQQVWCLLLCKANLDSVLSILSPSRSGPWAQGPE